MRPWSPAARSNCRTRPTSTATSTCTSVCPTSPRIETLAIDAPGQEGRDAKKRVGTVTLLVHQSAARFEVGHEPRMRRHERQAWEPTGLVDDTLEVHISPEYNKHGSVKLRVIEPLPLTILGIIPRGEIGG